eukprot:scaffold19865_cov32-Phaeocystis_antarctica.AAC.2
MSETESTRALYPCNRICNKSAAGRQVCSDRRGTSEQPPPPERPTASTRHVDSCTSAVHRRAAAAAAPRSSAHAPAQRSRALTC